MTQADQYIVQLDGTDRKPKPLLNSKFNEWTMRISPDGRLFAYTLDDIGGRPEIYVDSFPLKGDKRRVSRGGGRFPEWRSDGAELYYLTLDQELIAVTVDSSLSFARSTLFHAPRMSQDETRRPYQPDKTGSRFLFNARVEDPTPQAITVLLNWQSAIK